MNNNIHINVTAMDIFIIKSSVFFLQLNNCFIKNWYFVKKVSYSYYIIANLRNFT